MSYSITVSNLVNNVSWQKQLSEEEVKTIKKDNPKGAGRIAILKATLFPVRTNTLKNLINDLSLPTTFHYAMHVEHAVGKIFAILAALVLDILTLPIRAVTCIPRIIYNYTQPKAPFHKYLIEQNVDPELLKTDQVRVKLNFQRTQTSETTQKKLHERNSWEEWDINFIELPAALYPDHDRSLKIGSDLS